MPLISAVVPVYKTEMYLKQCIDSIINQTFKDYEIILVDDGSPDNCPQICDIYASEYSFIKVVHKENGGLVSARKAGVAVARGDYVIAIDSDDFIKEDYLQGFADAIKRNNADIIAGTFCTYKDGKEVPFRHVIDCGIYTKSNLKDEIYSRMLYTEPFYTFGIYPSLWTKCIRRELVIENQNNVPDDIRMGEDAAVTYACMLDAASLEIIYTNGYMYRYNDSSITRSYDPNMASRCISLIEYMYSLSKRKGWDAKDQLYAYTLMIQDLVVKNEMRVPKNRYTNLKVWVNNLCVQKILSIKCNLKISFIKRVEAFAVRNRAFWVLTIIKCLRKIKWKICNIK